MSFDEAALDARVRAGVALPGVETDDPDWWSRWRQHLAIRAAPRWFYEPDTAPAFFAEHWPALTRRWLEGAEALLTDLVHAGDFRPGRLPAGDGEDGDVGNIDWGANPTRSMSWAGFHYWSWANPWIRAYGLSGDERYPAELARHLRSYVAQIDSFTPQLWDGAPERDDWRDWVVHNDLSAGIKMATLAEALAVFRRAEAWTADDARRATLLLVHLATRVFDTYRDASDADLLKTLNFLTSGAAGLGVVAVVLPELDASAAWLDLARRVLEVHLLELYYPDGGHRELCTQYHKAGLRDILFLEQALLAAGHKPLFLEREPYRGRLLAALRWLTAIRLPDGSTAVLNSAAASDDWLVPCLVANKVLGDDELAWHVGRAFREDYVPRQKARPALISRILGTGDAPDPARPGRPPSQTSVLLPDSGVAVLRDGWDADASCVVVDFGHPVGGHAYPARGAFTLALKGRLVAQSPGSPHAYTDPDYRGWMHASRSQNAVLVDDADQAQWVEPGRRLHGEILHWETEPGHAAVQGRHAGYREAFGIDCVRTVYLGFGDPGAGDAGAGDAMGGGFILVHDVVDATEADADHVARWSLQCAEPMSAGDAHVAEAPGLVRVQPAWPGTIEGLEMATEGKAVWPAADSDNPAISAHRRLHQVRWRVPVRAGGACCFLMLLSAPEDGWRLHEVGPDNSGALAVTVTRDGDRRRAVLPGPP